MRIKALSHYDGDKKTRYGDCILGFSTTKLFIYDCGHERHAEEVMRFLAANKGIRGIATVISHNDSDHTNGVTTLLEQLEKEAYEVSVYTSLYLKSVDEIHNMLDDGRRKKNKTCEHILELFNHIAEIVEMAEEYGFVVENALPDTDLQIATIVGPTEEEFVQVVAKAIEEDGQGNISGESVMNAASVQLKCILDDKKVVLLCGDASPDYLHDLEEYDIIQLPHHGQLADAESIFDKLEDPHSKDYLISDNTGSGQNSGGSDKLVKLMKDERFSLPYNTKEGTVELPSTSNKNNGSSYKSQGVRLGDLDCRF